MRHTIKLEACEPNELVREPTPEGVYFRVDSVHARSASGFPIVEVASDSEVLLWAFLKDRWGDDEADLFIENMRQRRGLPPLMRHRP